MTSTEMLARLRTRLDESSAGFWSDSECYSALTDGQIEVLKFYAGKNSPVVRPLVTIYTKTGISGTTTALPSDYLEIYSLKAHAKGFIEKPCLRREGNRYKDEDNPYLSSEEDEVYYAVIGSNVVFETTFSNGSITMDYIAKPSDINAATEPTIDSTAHNAVVLYAHAFLLSKAKLPSGDAYKLFREAL